MARWNIPPLISQRKRHLHGPGRQAEEDPAAKKRPKKRTATTVTWCHESGICIKHGVPDGIDASRCIKKIRIITNQKGDPTGKRTCFFRDNDAKNKN